MAAPAAAVTLLSAKSLAGACAALQRTMVDVVILNLSPPDRTGFETLRRLRAAAPAVPVFVLTDRADEAAALEALRLGAQDYVLTPPPDGRTLRRILRYGRERQHLLQKLDAAVQESETMAGRWRLLAEVGKVLTRFREPEDAIAEVARLVVPEAADGFIVYLMADDQVPAVVEIVHDHASLDFIALERLRDPFSKERAEAEAAVQAFALAEAGNLDEPLATARALLTAIGAKSGSVVPLRVSNHVRGLLVLTGTSRTAESQHAATDSQFAHSLGDRIALTLEECRVLRQAKRAAAMQDRAVGVVSHDLRNLLSTIQICAAALLDPDPPPPDGGRSVAELIQRSATCMQQIVQDLFDRVSLDLGRLVLDRKPTAVAELLAAAQIMFAPVGMDRSVSFVVESADDLPRIDADPDRLLQVLSNLLGNAMKFTPAGGRVVLSTRMDDQEPAGGAVRFTVSDTGTGIAAEDLPHVFDWFWQSRPGKQGGAGLGLAIAKGLVEAHRSRLRVESTSGHGSTFWFAVPAASAA
jgi:signal transduction histidine kinase